MRDVGGAGIHVDLPPGIGGPAFRNQEVALTELVSTENAVLDRMTFSECRIFGPAVLVLVAGSQLTNSNLGGPPDAILWPLPDVSTIVGAVVANACVFDHCEFFNIGFGMPPDQIPAVRARLQGTDS